ncbi:MAG TPA: hypothetical protein VH917_04905, partial [Ignavibacteriaceae bacterium]
MMNRTFKILNHFILPILLFCFISFATAQTESSDSNISGDSISIDNISKHVQILASDEFGGRGTGQPGGDLAAKYLESEFRKIGLKPSGDDKTFYQYIPMHSSEVKNSSQLVIYQNERNITLNLGKDYLMLTSGEQTYIPTPVSLVFAGYGIQAPEFDYNDYHSINVEGKIVVYL